MKRIFLYFMSIFALFFICPHCQKPQIHSHATTSPIMSIVIDDFGSYDESGVQTLLLSDIPLTCAVIPNVDNTKKHIAEISNSKNKEIILHMPMEAHVNLPKDWYGPVYISSGDTRDTINNKFKECLKDFPSITGFNIHIGSGVSKNKTTMKHIYDYAKEHELYFLDSRTIETNAPSQAATETGSFYLGRDEFLEADKNKSYANVKYRLLETAKTAKEKGYGIAIGHVGAEGGENTAKAIIDTLPEIERMGIKVVTLNELYNTIKICDK